MQDQIRMGDGVAVKMECGHPNVKRYEKCPLCGKTLLSDDFKEDKVSEIQIGIGQDISR